MGAPASPFYSLILLVLFLVSQSPGPVAAGSFPKEALPSKSGYLEVNSTTGSAIFYAFYESQTRNAPLSQIPILVWLQGGPGCSSMLGNMFELGPWLVNQNASLYRNPYSWNNVFALLFLDSPIGTGFSIAASPGEIPRTQTAIARHLLIAIQRFLDSSPSFRKRPIYITGESYAGKYLPALGYHILEKNPLLPREKRVNLAGVAIGNGLTDPALQISVIAANAYYLGLINEAQRSILEKLQTEAVDLARREKWIETREARFRVLNTTTNMTGLATLYDFRRLTPYPTRLVTQFLNDRVAKKALGVNESMAFTLCSTAVADALREDGMKSARPMVEYLVKRKTRVLLYQGQTDLRDGVVSTLAWVEKMKWEGIQRFLEAERKIWRVNEELAGYVQQWENFSEAVVMNAGHLVPTDQPRNSRLLMQDWILQEGLFAV